jgi:16S rRNA (cytidine1402-2'-O)-methyltransferase
LRRERTRHLTETVGSGGRQAASDLLRSPEASQTGRARKLDPGLYLVATPIGNLEDLTRRAERVLAEADLVLCEDRRVTSRLLRHLGLARPLSLYHEHNAERVRPGILERLAAGASVALVSDAGTPAISDPGYKLVHEAIAQGVAVRPVPGASAVLAAITASGLPTDRFLFQGFLPPRQTARRRALSELAPVRATLVLFESAQRLGDMLADAAAVLGPRPAVVARELTKLHEELRRGLLPELADGYRDGGAPKGEVVVVIAPPDAAPAESDDAVVDDLLRLALTSSKPRIAAGEVAAVTGRSANELYRRALALAHEPS